jgi:hypothetical protein
VLDPRCTCPLFANGPRASDKYFDICEDAFSTWGVARAECRLNYSAGVSTSSPSTRPTSPQKRPGLCGVRHVRCTTLEALGTRLSTFDSLVLFGNNFGILQNPTRAHSILKKIAETTKNDARIFVESTNAYYGGAPGFDRSYYFANKRRGVAPGQLRVRYRYDALTGSWFNWIYVSPSEMRAILVGTGWHQERVFSSIPSDPYVALLVKD